MRRNESERADSEVRFDDFDDLEGVEDLRAYQEQVLAQAHDDFVTAKSEHGERVVQAWRLAKGDLVVPDGDRERTVATSRLAEDWDWLAHDEAEFIIDNRLPHRYEDFVRAGREDVYWRFRFVADWGTAARPGTPDDWDWPYPSWRAKADAERRINRLGFLPEPETLVKSRHWRPLGRYIHERYGSTAAYRRALGWEHAGPCGRHRPADAQRRRVCASRWLRAERPG